MIVHIGFLKCRAVSGEFGCQCGVLNKLYPLDAQIHVPSKKEHFPNLHWQCAPESRCKCVVAWPGRGGFYSRLAFKFQVSASAGCLLSHMSDNIPRFYYPHVNSTADGSLGPFNYDQGESRPQAA